MVESKETLHEGFTKTAEAQKTVRCQINSRSRIKQEHVTASCWQEGCQGSTENTGKEPCMQGCRSNRCPGIAGRKKTEGLTPRNGSGGEDDR